MQIPDFISGAEVGLMPDGREMPREFHRMIGQRSWRGDYKDTERWREKMLPSILRARLQRIPHSCPLDQEAVGADADGEVVKA